MRDEHDDVGPIELGTVSNDTQGAGGIQWETAGMRREIGISDE